MEAITIIPKNKKQQNVLIALFKEMNIDFATVKQTLEDKILNLYKDKHYTKEDLDWFFSIPEKYRVDPFDMIEDGDIFYADQRNIDQLEKDFEQHKIDIKNGNYNVFDNAEDLNRYIESL